MSPRSRPRRRNPGLVLGLALLGGIVLVAALAPILFTERAAVLGPRFAAPSSGHWLGTDAAGHDVLLRSLVATRLTLLMTVGATAMSVVFGVVLGTGVWLVRPRVREVCLRVIDAMVAFPGLLLALVVAAVLGAGGSSAVIAIGLSGIPYFARLTANLAAKVSQQEYVSTAGLLGVSRTRIAIRHMLPNMAEPLLVLTASTFAATLTAISALSFVGLGVQSPSYDWGKLLNEALPSLLADRPFQMVGPAFLIVLTGLGAVLIGDGLAAAANPRGHTAPGRSATPPAAQEATGEQLADVRDLWIHAGDTPLVKGISFGIGPGEIVGIVGESGSGKTLTAMSLARLLPDGLTSMASRMAFGDLDLRRPVPPALMAEAVSLIYQDPGSTFNPALRMGTQLTEVLRTHKRLGRREAARRILDALRVVHLTRPEQRMKQHPHELSGGMRQRAMIAAALSVEPRLIIADEPTTALDVTVQAEILRELKRVNREFGASIMFISHDIGVVRALCDRVLVMYRGEIVEEIAAAELTVETARHPYTRALLEATPDIDASWTPPRTKEHSHG
ncbi:dipeptide/oligopeptide/nickel ABC transporter permease/ATP-binding protein [Nonomuraea jabiensis]|uniref:ABC-type dipeptide/oligopeptide/nickel transport system ATPase component/ABC-type dipeptide/oligopeptide/nickel transport system permease subunit n=1 Tax=Nonomuraea jabiensis TaxID=882448 RepID=A0A7W9GFJ2_9ACTN|nr:dipeptide/oligopeptide/nickel ABC transporter permease/ATP-binding protein [Nonomuraea jabiensis]MBB5782899.1 ABC-type dipeptide/oligopeptide/nickel transport system ATPase component/ABC-type dipeptide/oligopeptide/nickel transport system permease subunit [Nonomuraea jabiensis]